MKLMTKQLEEVLKKHPFGSQEEKGEDAKVLVKYFNPTGPGTWLITEGEKHLNDWVLYGYMHVFQWEWGYILLSELKNIELPNNLGIERDFYIYDQTVKELSQ